MRSRRRWTWGTALLALASLRGTAAAEPADLVLLNQVAAGKRPTITLVAKEAISAVTLDVERDDHRSFHARLGALAVGAHAELPVGDGKLGRAHWKGKLVVRGASGDSTTQLDFESTVGGGAALKVTYDRAHLDLEHGQLQFQISRPAARAELTVVGEDGETLAHAERSLAAERAGQWIAIGWPPAEHVLRLELRIASDGGDAVIVRLVPWSVAIAHEEVVFPSGVSAVPASETGKLDASFGKIVEAVAKVRKVEPALDVRVYVVGHTDTVGSAEDNRALSQARARAIAAWFREHGLPMPLYYAGLGEDQPKVKTADNVDELRNRRVDYVVGVEEPALGRGHFSVLR